MTQKKTQGERRMREGIQYRGSKYPHQPTDRCTGGLRFRIFHLRLKQSHWRVFTRRFSLRPHLMPMPFPGTPTHPPVKVEMGRLASLAPAISPDAKQQGSKPQAQPARIPRFQKISRSLRHYQRGLVRSLPNGRLSADIREDLHTLLQV